METNTSNHNTKLKTNDLLAIVAIIVSVVSLVSTIIITVLINNKTNTLTKKLNSKEYQMSENVKYDLIEMTAVLRSIDLKIELRKQSKQPKLFDTPIPIYSILNDSVINDSVLENDIAFSEEIISLNDIQSRPDYLFFLHSIENRSDRLKIEIGLKKLTDFYLVSNSVSLETIQNQVFLIQNVLAKNIGLKDNIKMDFDGLMKELCSSDVSYSEEEWSYDLTFLTLTTRGLYGEPICEFLEMLIDKGNTDPDVHHYYYTFCNYNPELANMAIGLGAHDVDTLYDFYFHHRIQIIQNLISQRDSLFTQKDLTYYVFCEDVGEKFGGIYVNNTEINGRVVIVFPSAFGTNIAVSAVKYRQKLEENIINKYKKEYQAFYRGKVAGDGL